MQLSSLLANKKIIFIFVGIVLAAELTWAVLTLTKGEEKRGGTKNSPVVSSAKVSSLSLVAPVFKKAPQVGEEIPVSINISSNKATDGVDIILLFDPNLLSVVPSPSAGVVSVGTIYSDYPLNQVDEKTGKIMVSGITSKPGGVLAEGVFGTVTFRPKKVGKAKVSFDFTPGSTTDSNVIETKTAQDILGTVNNLEISIQ